MTTAVHGPELGQLGPPADPAPEIRWLRHPAGHVRWARWAPSERRADTVWLLLPGRTEYLEKYDHVAAWLMARGAEVIALDWFGQGLSSRPLTDPERHHVTRWRHQGWDLDRLVDAAGLKTETRPIHVLAHSMAGLTFLDRWQARPPLAIESATVIAPFLGAYGLEGRQGTLALLAKAGCVMGLGRSYAPSQGPWKSQPEPFETNVLTHDADHYARMVKDYREHPALRLGGVTWSWIAASFTAQRRLFAGGLRRITVPVTFVSAEEEAVVSNDAVDKAAALMPGASLLRCPGARHEVLMETADRAQPLYDHLERVLGV